LFIISKFKFCTLKCLLIYNSLMKTLITLIKIYFIIQPIFIIYIFKYKVKEYLNNILNF